MIGVQINTNLTTERIGALYRRLQRPSALLKVLGREGRNQLVRHFRGKNENEPNKLGGKRTKFWLQVARSVQAPVVHEVAGMVVISITHPAFAQKVYGGVIRAKRVRNLAIPVTAESYGRAPKVFETETGLQLIFLKQRDTALLASVDPVNANRLTVRYLLTPSVDQDADPTALPGKDAFNAAIVGRAESWARNQIGLANGGSAPAEPTNN